MDDSMKNVWNTKPPTPHSPTQRPPNGEPAIGLAVASLILGVVAIAAAVMLTGALFGVVGVILGAACLASRRSGKKMAG